MKLLYKNVKYNALQIYGAATEDAGNRVFFPLSFLLKVARVALD